MATSRYRIGAAAPLVLALAVTAPLPAHPASQAASNHGTGAGYQVRNLVSDGTIPADHVDRLLVNAWGLAFGAGTPAWVADAGTGVATVYDGRGNPARLVVTIPGGSPTGIVANASPLFVVRQQRRAGPSRFIFASEAGVIAGWSPLVSLTSAIVGFHATDGAIYKGLALATSHGAPALYATDFHNAKIDVLDASFRRIQVSGGFRDPGIPSGFAPFGIQNLGGKLYVTYAKQDQEREDDVAGPGLGFVDVFDAEGHRQMRLASGGALNAPWGLVKAPRAFGRFGGDILVGNFGDGRINAYDPDSGTFVGGLREPNGGVLAIDGLWGLSFGNGARTQPLGTLFFAAGPDDERHGLFGRIDAVVRH
jgi:uncharacterized protein (TIGR03118 family)